VQAVQLSEGGMLFQSSESFAVGDAIVLSIIVPGGSSVVVRGDVIYSRPAPTSANAGEARELQFGVKFAPLTLPLRRLIRIYVTAKTQAEAEAEQFDN
jgi:Tfp pilus assembly protein PilZ